MSACDECLRRRWLLQRLAPRLERERARIDTLIGLDTESLIGALGGRQAAALRRELDALGPAETAAVEGAELEQELEVICRHADGYPAQLRELTAPPAVLSVNGGAGRLAELSHGEMVAIVGTRHPTQYGAETARDMARGLEAAGVTVISGMAYGIDSAAHDGALLGGGRTVAVLSRSAARATPAGKATLFKRLLGSGVALSELGVTAESWRWALQARNRIIAGLAALTVLIEGTERSGAMITVRHADRLGRPIGVLPGQVGVPQAAGPNLLLAKARAGRHGVDRPGVWAVRDAQDVLDLLYGEGIVDAPDAPVRAPPTDAEAVLLARIRSGPTNAALIAPGELAALSGLEIKGWVSRATGGVLTAQGG